MIKPLKRSKPYKAKTPEETIIAIKAILNGLGCNWLACNLPFILLFWGKAKEKMRRYDYNKFNSLNFKGVQQ
jgi:hypothetical protein